MGDTAFDWRGVERQKPSLASGYRLVVETSGVEIFQLNQQQFAVRYGLQLNQELSYAEAASIFGRCVLHSLTCEGIVR